jgi:hypothetical protein
MGLGIGRTRVGTRGIVADAVSAYAQFFGLRNSRPNHVKNQHIFHRHCTASPRQCFGLGARAMTRTVRDLPYRGSGMLRQCILKLRFVLHLER